MTSTYKGHTEHSGIYHAHFWHGEKGNVAEACGELTAEMLASVQSIILERNTLQAENAELKALVDEYRHDHTERTKLIQQLRAERNKYREALEKIAGQKIHRVALVFIDVVDRYIGCVQAARKALGQD